MNKLDLSVDEDINLGIITLGDLCEQIDRLASEEIREDLRVCLFQIISHFASSHEPSLGAREILDHVAQPNLSTEAKESTILQGSQTNIADIIMNFPLTHRVNEALDHLLNARKIAVGAIKCRDAGFQPLYGVALEDVEVPFTFFRGDTIAGRLIHEPCIVGIVPHPGGIPYYCINRVDTSSPLNLPVTYHQGRIYGKAGYLYHPCGENTRSP